MAKLARAKSCVGNTIEMPCGSRYSITDVVRLDSDAMPLNAVVTTRSPKKNSLAFQVKPLGKSGQKFSVVAAEKMKNYVFFIVVPSRIQRLKFV